MAIFAIRRWLEVLADGYHECFPAGSHAGLWQNRIDTGQYASASDYVRDLIRRDQSETQDVERWLHELDASIERELADANAGRVHDLDEACDTIIDRIRTRAAAQTQ